MSLRKNVRGQALVPGGRSLAAKILREPKQDLSRCQRGILGCLPALQLDASPRMYRPQPTGGQSQFPGDGRNRL